ncbi:MAG: cbb3-type cytochrome c oxidase subunit I, partial [Haloechinothrix sp.]
AVWAHHMYATGAVLLPFFSLLTFVVAHFHYVLFGTIVLATFAGIYFRFPKMTGRMLDEPLGKLHFWLTFIGFHGTFLVQHWLGNEGMPRRYADYLESDGFTLLNTISTVGAFVLGLSMLVFFWNVVRSYRFGDIVTVDDPWGYGNSLEWATTCPPPRHNFLELPRIRSERPAFELHYPHMIEQFHNEGHITLTGRVKPHAAESETLSEKAAAATEPRGDESTGHESA